MYRVLEADLSREKFSEIIIGEEEISLFLGGKGLADWLIYKNLKPGVDALSEENILIFMTGPLSGTPAPSSGRISAVSKSPLTGTIAESHCGGYFALALRRAGYLGVVIKGKARDRIFLNIGEEPSFEDASELWGKDTREAERDIKKIAGNGAEVLAIGKAGENLVRFASIIHQGHRAFGRAGLGAVMGSKNLKAIAAHGKEKIPLAEREKFLSLSKLLYGKLAKHPTTGEVLKKYGTPNVLAKVNYIGLLPTRNFTSGVFEGAEKISGEEVFKHIKKSYGCYSCATKCGKEVEVDGYSTKSLEYETLFACGSNLGISSLKEIIKLNEVCNSFGMDTISFGVTVASFIEGARKGYIDYRIDWGEAEEILKLAEKIARREGIGDALAEGSYRFWKNRNKSLSVSVKGMELPGYDARGARGLALAYATSNRGACHLRGPVYIDEILAQTVDRSTPEGKAELVKKRQDFHSAIDSLILCKFTSRALEPKEYAELFTLATGIEINEEELLRAGERIFNLERLMNTREGFRREEDTLPDRLLREPLPEGPSQGRVAELDTLEEYYRIRGWNAEGIPEKEKLKELKIEI